jgi:DNA-binding NtrC family response regulator
MDSPRNILVVDDQKTFLSEAAALLRPHFHTTTCSSPLRAVRLAKRGNVDLVLTTLVMRELDGFEVIRRIRGAGLRLPVIMITGFGDENSAIEATRLGADDYLDKPVEPQELISRIRRALDAASPVSPLSMGAPSIVTGDPQMRRVLHLAARVAGYDSRVLITGETGTGKELVAKSIHSLSARRSEPFIEVNCAAIPASLIESELFGHERGAFTGATERRTGRFEEAGAGTIFLDEIGELGRGLQAKLLHVLQTGEFSRVGSSRTLKSMARVIAATNRDLVREVSAGRFRADLFYRLNVVSLEVPPLREREGDIPLLVDFFAERLAARRGAPLRFSPAVLQRLCRHPWPGNVRELEHLVERLSVIVEGGEAGLSDLPAHLRQSEADADTGAAGSSKATYQEAFLAFERAYFQGLLEASGPNLAAAARLAGIDRSQFFRKVTALGLHQRTRAPKAR